MKFLKRLITISILILLLKRIISEFIVYITSTDDIDTAPEDYALNGDQADIDIAFRENKASNVSKPPHLGIKWTKE